MNDTLTSSELWHDTISTNTPIDYISTIDFMMGTDTATPTCHSGFTPCNDSRHIKHCLNGGICCFNDRLNALKCWCTSDFSGHRCETRFDGEYDYVSLESRERKLTMISVASIISLMIGLIALIAFIVLIILIIRNKLSLRQKKHSIEDNLLQIEKEINQMPTVSKLVQLTRLTKKFEESVRVTTDEVMQSAAIADGLKEAGNLQLLSDTARNYLPRWSSAPSCLQSNESADVLDGKISPYVHVEGNRTMIPLITLDARRKLQAMVSNPI